MIRTVADLIRELEDINSPDAPVYIASADHRSAFAYRVSAVIDGDPLEGDRFAVYLGEGGQVGYLPSDVRDQI